MNKKLNCECVLIGYEFECFSFLIIAVLFSSGNAKKTELLKIDRFSALNSTANPENLNTQIPRKKANRLDTEIEKTMRLEIEKKTIEILNR